MYDLSFGTCNIEEDMIKYLLLNGFAIHAAKTYDKTDVERINSFDQIHKLKGDYYYITASIKTDNIGGIMNGLLKYNPSTVNIKRCD